MVRGLLETLGTVLWFKAIKQLPLTEVTALTYLCPLLIAIGAILFLGEKNRIYRWVALLIGFLGVIMVIHPKQEVLMPNIGAIFALGSAFCFATCGIILKILTKTEGSQSVIFYMFLFTGFFSFVMAYSDLSLITLKPNIIIFILIAVSYLFLQMAVAKAFSHAVLTLLMPFSFLGLIFVTIAGYAFFEEVPRITALFGGIIILGSVIGSAFYEGRRAKKKLSVLG